MFLNLNLNLKPKLLITLSLIFTITGIIFILASRYIGPAAIRIAMILCIIFCLINYKTSYYLSKKEKITYIIAMAGALIGLFKPEFTMLILGIFLFYLTIPIYLKAVKNKDYSDFISLIISGIGMLFALFCIFSSKTALNTVIIIMGIIFILFGCLLLYQVVTKKEWRHIPT